MITLHMGKILDPPFLKRTKYLFSRMLPLKKHFVPSKMKGTSLFTKFFSTKNAE
jgi:hypothetical protein